MKSSFCIDLQRFMLIPTKFPLTRLLGLYDPPLIVLNNNRIKKENVKLITFSFL